MTDNTVPSRQEIDELAAAADPVLNAAITVMATAGLRVGGLPGLSIHGERFTTSSKGKDHTGGIPEQARRAIEKANLSLRTPFSHLTASKISDRFFYLARKLHAAGKLRNRYSVHDLRHAYAVRLYQQTRDVYAVKEALGHATVGVTEHYLRSLNLSFST